MTTIKENYKRYKEFEKYKEINNVHYNRGTGRTTRLLFEMASYHPLGEFIFICHSIDMARWTMNKFIDIQLSVGAPIRSVNRSDLTVRLHGAKYRFMSIKSYKRLEEMQRLNPNTKTFEDHCVWGLI